MEGFLKTVLEFGQERAAKELTIAKTTLSNKLQPYDNPDRRHYLNLFEADSILEITGDMRGLELLAAKHGFVLLPVNVTPDAETLDAEKLQDYQALAKCHAEEDPVKCVHRLNATIRELLETHAMRNARQ